MLILSIIIDIILFVLLSYTTYDYYKEAVEKKENKEHLKEQLLTKIDFFINQVEQAQSLGELYILHIKIWANGIRCKNFGPNKYGMFRTEDILMMTPNDVYLGNICGLWTFNLPYWENSSEENQKIVINQYKNILVSNMIGIRDDITTKL